MLNIRMDRNRWTVDMDGHAGYAEKGHDIVCAAASILSATLMRTLGGINGCDFSDDGEHTHISCNPTLAQAEYVATAMDVIDHGFQLLANSYPVHVTYTKYS